MAFKAARKTYTITWDDGDLAGLEMKVRGLGTGQLLTIASAKDGSTLMQTAVEPFSDALVEWNVEDEKGQPVPPTLEGVRGLDLQTVIPMIMKWMSAMADVDTPLQQASVSGVTSEVPPPGLASSSRSLTSS